MAGWTNLEELITEEVQQRKEEGCNVGGFLDKIEAAGVDKSKLMMVYEELMALPVKADFPYSEPNGLEAIRQERPSGPRKINRSLSDGEWQDKFLGAWLGRSAGCALGKPLEMGPFMGGTENTPGWKNVQRWFEGADAWPIDGYTPGQSRHNDILQIDMRDPNSQRENISFMESDDDIRYTVLGLIMLEEKGKDFDSWDMGKLWHQRLTYQHVCTAETQAYFNFAHVTSHTDGAKPDDWKEKQHWVRTHLNPYREWIGAQIRADGLAYGAAGNPQLAAEFGWRDASFSHVKNGIYGEMFVSAMIAASFVEDDIEKVIDIGLSEIPKDSRLAHDIRKAIEITKQAQDQVQLVDQIWEAFKHYHPVHTNNNATLVVASLLYANGEDFEKAITTAVLGGWDTDCNGATVGSIMGAKLGAKHLPGKWIDPLNDTLYAEINDFHPISISECAKRSYQVFKAISE